MRAVGDCLHELRHGIHERRDQFLIRYSKIANKNLGPFFDFWGIPVSSSAKAEVSKLEAWMPKGL
jgi:hypothetical protein